MFCGTAVGPKSAARGAYYAGPGNRFYQTLNEIGLTPAQLEPEQCWDLARYGIGLTDLAKKVSALDDGIEKNAWDVGRLSAMIEGYAPKAVAFNGKRAAREFLGGEVAYGPFYDSIGESAVYVLPSTSGAARRCWNVKYWHELAAFVRGKRYFDWEAPA